MARLSHHGLKGFCALQPHEIFSALPRRFGGKVALGLDNAAVHGLQPSKAKSVFKIYDF
jgi:hypothetical protein